MEFAELIAAKDAAFEKNAELEEVEEEAHKALQTAEAQLLESLAALVAAHKAIHDVLAEKGEHYLVDQKDGTLTVYKPSDEPPGYLAVHPIPGTKKAAK